MGLSLGIVSYSSAVGYDADAQSFFNSVELTDSLTTPVKNKINQFVIDLKVDGTWSQLKFIYPFAILPTTNNARKWNLKNTAAFQATFYNSPTHSSSGVAFNGSTQYVDTGFNPSTQLTQGYGHLGYYSNTSAASGGSDTDMGVDAGGHPFRIIIRRSGNLGYVLMANSTGTDYKEYTITDASGHFVGIINANALSYYRNASALTENSSASYGSQFPNATVFIGGYNSGGGLSEAGVKTCAIAHGGIELSSSQVTTLNNAAIALLS